MQAKWGAHAALIDIGRGVHYSYRVLATEVEAARAAMQRREKALIALLAERDVGAITCYLAAQCRLPPQCISRQRLSVIPRTHTGKIFYPTL